MTNCGRTGRKGAGGGGGGGGGGGERGLEFESIHAQPTHYRFQGKASHLPPGE